MKAGQPKDSEAPFVGLISDTHGLMRPEALAVLAGATRILHAGDVGRPGILTELGKLAELDVVRGNVDTSPWTGVLPTTRTVEIKGIRIHILHDLYDLVLPDDIDVVLSGHTHRPLIEDRDGVLFVNPGSAGPRRSRLPISVARLYLTESKPRAEIVELVV